MDRLFTIVIKMDLPALMLAETTCTLEWASWMSPCSQAAAVWVYSLDQERVQLAPIVICTPLISRMWLLSTSPPGFLLMQVGMWIHFNGLPLLEKLMIIGLLKYSASGITVYAQAWMLMITCKNYPCTVKIDSIWGCSAAPTLNRVVPTPSVTLLIG